MRTLAQLVLIAACAAACSSKPKTQEAAPAKAETPIAAATETKVGLAATEAKVSADNALTCAKGKDSRVLVARAKDKGCELAYTKNGQEAVVASGKSGLSHCEASREKIATKLKGAGYTCQ